MEERVMGYCRAGAEVIIGYFALHLRIVPGNRLTDDTLILLAITSFRRMRFFSPTSREFSTSGVASAKLFRTSFMRKEGCVEERDESHCKAGSTTFQKQHMNMLLLRKLNLRSHAQHPSSEIRRHLTAQILGAIAPPDVMSV